MKTNKTHNKIVKGIQDFYRLQIENLKEELKEARDLKEILTKISSTTINGIGFAVSGGSWTTMDLSEDVLVYVDDILGGKVIKQEGTKCIVVDSEGEVKTGLTKQKADKGFTYKLIRKTNESI